ncbi:hypothetical protein HanRHA438_Chr03g0139171 [Helianthus annuus]|nr:hypothetical protein HanRHA438_Chr03g0139171 [Helianthus annuus]
MDFKGIHQIPNQIPIPIGIPIPIPTHSANQCPLISWLDSLGLSKQRKLLVHGMVGHLEVS